MRDIIRARKARQAPEERDASKDAGRDGGKQRPGPKPKEQGCQDMHATNGN
eukprot:gene6497-2253_t